jgi:O-antigen/teichoic acid export membrane protein
LKTLIKKIGFSNVYALQLFQLTRFATIFLCSVLLVKAGADTSEIAVVETFLWLTGMSTFFWVGGSIQALLSISGRSEKSLFFNAFCWLLLQALAASAVLLLFYTAPVNHQAIAVLFIVMHTVSFLNEYILFHHKKSTSLIAYSVLSSLAHVACVVLPFLYFKEILFSLYGLVLLAALKFVLVCGLLVQYDSFRFDAITIKTLAKLSIPISMSILISGSAEYIDGFLVKYFFSEDRFALFRYGSREFPFSLILANTLSAAMVAAISQNREQGIMSLKTTSAKLSHLLFPVSIALMLGAKPLFLALYSDSYLEAVSIFRIMLLLVIPRLVFPQTVVAALQLNRFILISAVLELLLNVVLSVFLMKFLGWEGIVWGTLLAYSFDKIFLMAVLKKKGGVSAHAYINAKPLYWYSVLLVVSYVISEVWL